MYSSRFKGCCKDCKDRNETCHTTCEKYLQAKAEHEEMLKLIEAEKHKFQSYWDYQRTRFTKNERINRNNKKR